MPKKISRKQEQTHETDFQRARRQREEVKKHGVTGATPEEAKKRIAEHEKAKAAAAKKEGGGTPTHSKFKFNPFMLIGAAAAGLFMYTKSKAATTPSTTPSTTTTPPTTSSSNPSDNPSSNNGVVSGTLPPATGGTYSPPGQSSGSSGSGSGTTVQPQSTIYYFTVSGYTNIVSGSNLNAGALPGASVKITGGTVNTTGTTDSSGKFSIEITSDKVELDLTVEVSASGYKSYSETGKVTTASPNWNLGNIPMVSTAPPSNTTPSSNGTTSNPNNSATLIASFPAVVMVNVGTLYVRASSNDTSALVGSQELGNGEQFQVRGFVYGQDVSGENRWWYDMYDHFVWMGGTKEKVASGIAPYVILTPPSNTSVPPVVSSTPVSGTPSSSSGSTTASGAPPINFGSIGSNPSSGAAVPEFPMTVHVNVNLLYVRSAPNSSAPLAGSQELHYGDSFTAQGYVTGEMVSGENRWWQSSFGNYVWAGGTEEKP